MRLHTPDYYETLPRPHFRPRYLQENQLARWNNPPPSQPAIVIQSAVRGGPTFEPAKLWELQTLAGINPAIIGVHSFAGPDAPTEVANEQLEKQSVPFILANIRQALNQGWRGIFINDCMADPDLQEAREMIADMNLSSQVEMVAPAETSLKDTVMKHDKIAIVGVADAIPIFERLTRTYGVAPNLVGVYVESGLTPSHLHEVGLDQVATSLYGKITQARNDGAKAIVFGCTTLGGTLEVLLKQHPELTDFPMIEPMLVTLRKAAQRVKQMSV